MTTVVFETATLASSLKKAEQVAPSKLGNAFDKAAGILLTITPDGEVKCVVQATNLDVSYLEVVSCLRTEGVAVKWRLPSVLLSKYINSLPHGAGKEVKFEDLPDKNQIIITSGRSKAAITLMDPSYYPQWGPSSNLSFTRVAAIGGRISQVSWAKSSESNPPLCGIHFTGSHIIATDKYKVARMPCELPVEKPITIPASMLGAMLQQAGDVDIALTSTLVYIRPDRFTEISTVIYDIPYPDFSRIFALEYDQEVTLSRDELVGVIRRTMDFAGSDRYPRLRLYFGREEVGALLGSEDIGLVRDVVGCAGQIKHKRVEIHFTPKVLIDALTGSPNDKLSVFYNTSKPGYPLRLSDGSGYEAWVAPRGKDNPE